MKARFTSAPVPAALDAIREILEENERFTQNYTVETILELLQVCLTATNFRFLDRHYELVDGLAMDHLRR